MYEKNERENGELTNTIAYQTLKITSRLRGEIYPFDPALSAFH